MRFFLTAAFLLCASVAVRLVWAESAFRSGPADHAPRALRILGSTPNAAYSPSPQQALEQNPRLTSARIRLGLLQEQNADYRSAEQTMLQGARYDHQYFPAWTLSNYYFRRDDKVDFWKWSRAAIRLTNDPEPLLRLASLMEPDPIQALHRLGSPNFVIPHYLDLLVGAGRMDAAQSVVRTVLHNKTIRKEQLLDLTTRQLNAGNVSWALEIWNAIDAPIDPHHGPALPSAMFAAPDGEGFHVKPIRNNAIESEWHSQEASFNFAGDESDLCSLFRQPIPAPLQSVRYRLSYEYRGTLSGIFWRMAADASPALPPSADWRRGEWTVSVPPGSVAGVTGDGLRALSLQLVYSRAPGTIPARGEFAVRNLQLAIL